MNKSANVCDTMTLQFAMWNVFRYYKIYIVGFTLKDKSNSSLWPYLKTFDGCFYDSSKLLPNNFESLACDRAQRYSILTRYIVIWI